MMRRRDFRELYSFCSENGRAKSDESRLTVIRNRIGDKTVKQIKKFYGPTWYKTLGVSRDANKNVITNAIIAMCEEFVKKRK